MKENIKLTYKQKITLDYIDHFINENGYSPTYKEIAEMIDSPVCSAFNIVNRLINKGYLSMANGKWRTIRVVKTYDGR